MEFSCSVDINQPINRVVELWSDPENLKHWQDGFVSMEHLSGTPGQVGAKTKLVYTAGKKPFDLIETITTMNLPFEMSGVYEAKSMSNTMTNRFTEVSENVTRYETEIEYTRFTGIMIKVMAFLMPGIFQKQVQKWLNQFKAFAERS